MRRFVARGVIAMEELEELKAEAAKPEAEDVPVEEHAESAETDMLEADDLGDEADAATEDVEDGIDATEALEQLREVLVEAQAGNGLDATGAKLLRIAQESIYSRIGAAPTVVSLENFEGTARRMRATTVSLEELDKTVKELWAKLQKAIMTAWEWVKKMWAKIFDAATKLHARADKLIEAAGGGKLKGAPKAESLEKANLVAALHIGGTVDAGKAAEVLIGVGGAVRAGQQAMLNIGKKFATEATGDVKGLGAEIVGAIKGLTPVSNPAAEGFNKAHVARGIELPGGKAVVAQSDGEDASSNEIGVAPYSPKATAPESKAVKTLSPEDIVKVAEAVKKVAEMVDSLKAGLSAADGVKKELVASIKKHLSMNEVSAENKAAAKGMARFASHLLDQPGQAYSRYAVVTAKALLDYAELSIHQYGKGEEKKEGEAAAPAAEKTPEAAAA